MRAQRAAGSLVPLAGGSHSGTHDSAPSGALVCLVRPKGNSSHTSPGSRAHEAPGPSPARWYLRGHERTHLPRSSTTHLPTPPGGGGPGQGLPTCTQRPRSSITPRGPPGRPSREHSAPGTVRAHAPAGVTWYPASQAIPSQAAPTLRPFGTSCSHTIGPQEPSSRYSRVPRRLAAGSSHGAPGAQHSPRAFLR